MRFSLKRYIRRTIFNLSDERIIHRGYSRVCKMALAVLRQKQSPKRSGKTNKAVALANAANITTNELNMRDANGRTVLFYAARYGKIQAVKNLLNAGSNPNIADVDDSTPLHEATERCHYDVMKLLLSNGE